MTEGRGLDGKTRERVLDFLLRFNIAFKIAKVYEANNRLFLEQIEPLFGSLAIIIHTEGEASLALRQNALFFNQVSISTWPIIRISARWPPNSRPAASAP